MKKIITVPTRGTSRNLTLRKLTVENAKKQISFSNNVTELNVVSTLQSQGITNYDNITQATVGQNISTVLPSCFINCHNLQTVKTFENLQNIGEMAFANCENLNYVSKFDYSHPQDLWSIGESAFANCGFEKLAIHLHSNPADTSETWIYPYAFANNKNLKEVKLEHNIFIGDHEFANCTALTSFQMANGHSFFNPNAFENCTSLKQFTFPVETQMVAEEAFMNCTSLTSVTFDENPKRLSQINHGIIGARAFYGTGITSLTLPSGLTSFFILDDNALEGMDNLKEIHFNGMTDNDIATHYKKESETIGIDPGFIYAHEDKRNFILNQSNNIFSSSLNLNDYVIFKKNLDDIIEVCVNSYIPIICIRLSNGCGDCKKFGKTVLFIQETLTWIKESNKKCIIIFGVSQKVETYIRKFKNRGMELKRISDTGNFVAFFIYGKNKETGETIGVAGGDFSTAADHIPVDHNNKSFISNVVNKYFGDFPDITSEQIEDTLNTGILWTHCFGLCHDVDIYAIDSKTPYKYTYDPDSGGEEDDIIYEPEIEVDDITTDDFRFGQWYGNAKELREFAEKHSIPVFLEIGSEYGCSTCNQFDSMIFNTKEFQQKMANLKWLLCKITDMSTPQGKYVTSEWMSDWFEYSGKDLAFYYPRMMMYYYNKDGSVVPTTGETLPHIAKYYAFFSIDEINGTDSISKIDSLESIIEWIDSKQAYFVAYTPDPIHDLPTIAQISSYTPYNKYANQENDTYGRYFPVLKLYSPKENETFEISVNNASNVRQKYTIEAGQTENIPLDGTYQCFTYLSDYAKNNLEYQQRSQISGIIFKSGSQQIEELSDGVFEAPYGTITLDAFKTSFGIDIPGTSSDNFSIYKTEEDNEDSYVVVDGKPVVWDSYESYEIYNVQYEYRPEHMVIDSKNISKIIAYISAAPTVKSSDPPGTPDPDLGVIELTGTPYVLTAELYYKELVGPKIQWLSVFSNMR